MSFKREITPKVFASGTELTADLAGIGVLLAAKASICPNIEDTLIAASMEGLSGDLRVLALVVDWVDIHLPFVNADRLQRALKTIKDQRLLAFWVAIAQYHKADRRFSALARKRPGSTPLLTDQNDFLITRHGKDSRFANTCLVVPARSLRSRPSDIMNPRQLAARHLQYRYRVIMGPSYRADMWATIEIEPGISASSLARKCYGSFATAWKVIEDRKLLAA